MNIQATKLTLLTTLQPCPHEFQLSCGNCRLHSLCLPPALENQELEQLEDIIHRSSPLPKGEHLYREGDHFHSLYVVRSGSLKAYRSTNDGKEQVTGFYLPSEVLGLDGIGNDRYACSARTLETTAVCEIPFSSLEKLSTGVPRLQRHLFQLMSREIAADQLLITLLSKNAADERVAALLLSISTRNARRKLSATQFRLPMSRLDIGNYLGLTVETVSRVFSRMQKLGVLRVDNREVEILDAHQLHEIANVAD